ncbi:winged helix-turn-helix domain-containing protein [Natronococcus occultus]|uniref:winged helix-turn-helix domain-containing protein n=1 Tax=Natronococcus occultus TaxID=29288 RepID=UPI0015760875|nr:helix-turn-helix domain-containing protein [Natronococcus occultus]
MSTTAGVSGMGFLTQSPVRIRILRALYDIEEIRKRELKDRFDTSRVTVRRNVNALEERDRAAVSGRRCEITPLGELVVEDVLPASSSDPYAPVNYHIEALTHGERVRCLLPAVGLSTMTVARDDIDATEPNDGTDSEDPDGPPEDDTPDGSTDEPSIGDDRNGLPDDAPEETATPADPPGRFGARRGVRT